MSDEMENVGTIIFVVIIVVIGIVLLIFVLNSLGHPSKPTTKTNQALNPPVTTVTPAVVQFYDINVQYVYSGATRKNNVDCSYNTYTYIDSNSQTLNGSQIFYLQFQPSTNQCSMNITSITFNTPGFSLVNTEPVLPLSLPPNSQAQLQISGRAPPISYYGPLTMTIDYE